MPGRRRGRRPARVRCIGFAVAIISATLGGCARQSDVQAGAPTGRPRSVPTVMGHESFPRLVPRVKPSDPVAPTAQAGVQHLSDRIGQALAGVGDAAPAPRVSVKPAAGYQLQIAWVAGVAWPNTQAPLQVRRQVLAILDVVSATSLRHGTVLLMASGPMWAAGSTTRRKTSVVVRAKYSAHLIDSTRWTDVATQDVLGLCDDKAAVVARGYR